MLRRRPASFVAGRRAKRTIFALPSLVRSVERSATNIRFQSVGSTTANCHRYCDETSWWAGVGVDPLPIALELWRRSRSSQG